MPLARFLLNFQGSRHPRALPENPPIICFDTVLPAKAIRVLAKMFEEWGVDTVHACWLSILESIVHGMTRCSYRCGRMLWNAILIT